MSNYRFSVLTNIDLIREEEKKISASLNIFQTADWLSTVGEDLKVAICYDEEQIIKGYLPLVKTKKYGIRSYHIPPFTPYFGPVILENDLSLKKEIIQQLLSPFLKESHIAFMLPLHDQDVLPYVKLGFSIEARQNHIFSSLKKYTIDVINSGKARDIKRVRKKLDTGEISLIYGKQALSEITGLLNNTAERNSFHYNQPLFDKLLNAQHEENFFSVVVLDKDKNPLAGAYCPKDQINMYHLINASKRIEDKLLNLSNYLVLYLCAEHANENGLNFDFEGSNLPGVSIFYRTMGGEPTLKYRLQKTRSITYNILRSLERIRKERNGI